MHGFVDRNIPTVQECPQKSNKTEHRIPIEERDQEALGLAQEEQWRMVSEIEEELEHTSQLDERFTPPFLRTPSQAKIRDTLLFTPSLPMGVVPEIADNPTIITLGPAARAVLEISPARCNCKTAYSTKRCSCVKSGRQCTENCHPEMHINGIQTSSSTA